MTSSQVARAIPILGGIFSLGFRLGSMRKDEPNFPMRPRLIGRTTESMTQNEDGTVTTTVTRELYSNPAYDVFTKSKELYIDPFANSIPSILPQLELQLVLGTILVPLLLYAIHRCFLKN